MGLRVTGFRIQGVWGSGLREFRAESLGLRGLRGAQGFGGVFRVQV